MTQPTLPAKDPMTIAEKILAAHSGREKVEPGEFLTVKVDLVMLNDVTAPLAIKEFGRLKIGKVFDPSKVVIVLDHFVPSKDLPAAEQVKLVREFAQEQGIIFFPEGEGIAHFLLPERGLVLPGEVIIGGDSHTCTYGALGAFATGMGSTDIACALALGETWMKVPPTFKFVYYGKKNQWVRGKDLMLYTIGQIGMDGAHYAVMEFGGEVVKSLSMDERLSMANMAVEAGAKAAIFPVDELTLRYLKARTSRPFQIYHGDDGYAQVYEFDISKLEPQVAVPFSPANVKPVSEVAGIKIDQAFIGSCTDGRLEDLRIAAQILKGKRIHPEVRLIVLPGSRWEYQQALDEGLVEIFLEAGGIVGPPNCGPCLGGHMGVLGEGERCVATTNRNFIGRMGHPKSEVYLANAWVVATSALLGRIAHPEEAR